MSVYDATVLVSGVITPQQEESTDWQLAAYCELQWRHLKAGKSTNPGDTVWRSALLYCKRSGHFVYRPV